MSRVRWSLDEWKLVVARVAKNYHSFQYDTQRIQDALFDLPEDRRRDATSVCASTYPWRKEVASLLASVDTSRVGAEPPALAVVPLDISAVSDEVLYAEVVRRLGKFVIAHFPLPALIGALAAQNPSLAQRGPEAELNLVDSLLSSTRRLNQTSSSPSADENGEDEDTSLEGDTSPAPRGAFGVAVAKAVFGVAVAKAVGYPVAKKVPFGKKEGYEDEPTVPPSKRGKAAPARESCIHLPSKKPKVVFIGVYAKNALPVRQGYARHLTMEFFDPDSNPNAVKLACNFADYIYLMTERVPHKLHAILDDFKDKKVEIIYQKGNVSALLDDMGERFQFNDEQE